MSLPEHRPDRRFGFWIVSEADGEEIVEHRVDGFYRPGSDSFALAVEALRRKFDDSPIEWVADE